MAAANINVEELNNFTGIAFFANLAKRKYTTCDQVQMTISYESRIKPFASAQSVDEIFHYDIGTFPFKTSKGDTPNRFWCEFRPISDPDLMANEIYKLVKTWLAYDKRSQVFGALQFTITGNSSAKDIDLKVTVES